jgi:hypothetical protein
LVLLMRLRLHGQPRIFRLPKALLFTSMAG